MINAVARGTLNSKTPEATQELFEEMAMSDYQWCTSWAKSSKLTYVYDMKAIATLAIQVENLSRKIDELIVIQQPA